MSDSLKVLLEILEETLVAETNPLRQKVLRIWIDKYRKEKGVGTPEDAATEQHFTPPEVIGKKLYPYNPDYKLEAKDILEYGNEVRRAALKEAGEWLKDTNNSYCGVQREDIDSLLRGEMPGEKGEA